MRSKGARGTDIRHQRRASVNTRLKDHTKLSGPFTARVNNFRSWSLGSALLRGAGYDKRKSHLKEGKRTTRGSAASVCLAKGVRLNKFSRFCALCGNRASWISFYFRREGSLADLILCSSRIRV